MKYHTKQLVIKLILELEDNYFKNNEITTEEVKKFLEDYAIKDIVIIYMTDKKKINTLLPNLRMIGTGQSVKHIYLVASTLVKIVKKRKAEDKFFNTMRVLGRRDDEWI